MRADKIRAAELLFDAIGNIDDRIIQEAQTAPTRKPVEKRKSFTAIIALAATLTLIASVFAATLIAKIVDSLNSAPDEGHLEDYGNASVETNASLSQTLLDAESSAIVIVEEKDIDFFDGKTKIVWKQSGESDYHMVTLRSQADAAKLGKELKNQKQQIAPEDTESPECEVWITFGDGTVISPYLKTSAGNIGYAELFEYSPEIEPDADLTDLINDLISD